MYKSAVIACAGVDLLESADLSKDQTLFLSQIHQRALRRTMFPVGQYKKSFVKQLAHEAGLDYIVQKKEASNAGFWCFGVYFVFLCIFTMQCTIVQSAVLRLHVVCLSVCNVDGSGSHRLEILETNCTDN